MAESTLTLNYHTLRSEIGYELGYTRGNWDANQGEDIDAILDSGYRQMLNPPPVRDGLKAHEWSFMRPTTTLTTVASYSTGTITVVAGVVTLASGTFPSFGTAVGELTVTSTGVSYTVSSRDSATQVTLTDTSVTVAAGAAYTLGFPVYNLPDDWGSFIGPLTYRPGTGDLYGPVEVVGEYQIRAKRQGSDWFARPQFAATKPKTFDATTGQRFQIAFWPTPDDAYILTYRYNANPGKLTAANLYPLGGMRHSELLLASCLAVAEKKMNGTIGTHHANFMALLTSSVAFDANTTAPDFLGINNDRSDRATGMYADRWGHQDTNHYVTFNGVSGYE